MTSSKLPTGSVRELRITLGWPPHQLSPNARIHHMEHYRFKKAAKDTAYWLTREVLGRDRFEHDSEIIVGITAHPIEGKVAPDDDNLKASLKATFDGIALGLGVNDKLFRPQAIEWGEPVKHGRVVVEVRA